MRSTMIFTHLRTAQERPFGWVATAKPYSMAKIAGSILQPAKPIHSTQGPGYMSTNSSVQQNGKVRSISKSTHSPALRRLLRCLTAVQKGNFTVRLPTDWTGLEGKIA